MTDSSKSSSDTIEEMIVREKDRLLFDAGRAAREKFVELEERLETEKKRQVKRFALLVLAGAVVVVGIGLLAVRGGAEQVVDGATEAGVTKIQDAATNGIKDVQNELPNIDQAASRAVERIEQAERAASQAGISRTLTSLRVSFLTVQSGAASLYTLVSSRDIEDRPEFADHLTVLKQSWSDSAQLLELVAAGGPESNDPALRLLLKDTVASRNNARTALERVQTLFVDNNSRNQYDKGE